MSTADPAGAADPASASDIDFASADPKNGVGLCLSGGGYRAMLFHTGSLARLNEAGWLPKLTRVTSVSGGSIIAGRLGLRWQHLRFDADGRAGNFADEVLLPVVGLSRVGIDAAAVLKGLFLPGTVSNRVQAAYDRHLFHGATLQDLPDDASGPRFIVLATNLTNGTLWRFSRPYMRDWKTEPIPNPTVPLAQAVAASSAFPPVLSPSMLELPGGVEHTLTDGGVYDNLGLEPVVKNCHTVLVSDGGGMFTEQAHPHRDWIRGTIRVLMVMDVEVRRLRRRQVVGALAAGQRAGAFWAINTLRSSFPAVGGIDCPPEQTMALARVPTRLAKIERRTAEAVVNWGYLAADAALRSYVDTTTPVGTTLPFPDSGLGAR
jgi:NTE family protein